MTEIRMTVSRELINADPTAMNAADRLLRAELGDVPPCRVEDHPQYPALFVVWVYDVDPDRVPAGATQIDPVFATGLGTEPYRVMSLGWRGADGHRLEDQG